MICRVKRVRTICPLRSGRAPLEFLELGKDICFFRLDDHPFTIAGRIVEYLARTNTHKMFRCVMKKYVLDVVCRKEIMPFLRDITSQADDKSPGL